MPKTGGTAMRKFFKEQNLSLDEFRSGPASNSILIKKPVPFSSIELDTQHRVPTLQQLSTTSCDLNNNIIFSFVRDPYDWYQSYFYFKLNHKKWDYHGNQYPDYLFHSPQDGASLTDFYGSPDDFKVVKSDTGEYEAVYAGDNKEQLFDKFVNKIWLKSVTETDGKGPISFYHDRLIELVKTEAISSNIKFGKYEERFEFLKTIFTDANLKLKEVENLCSKFKNFGYLNKTIEKSNKEISVETMQKIYDLEKDIFNSYDYNKRF